MRNILRKSAVNGPTKLNFVGCVIILILSETMSVFKYKYFDSPDGQDIYKKTVCLSKYAAVAGFGIGTYDVLLYSHPKGPLATVGRYFFHVGPLVGMATAFTLTSNIANNVRGKNDAINYFIGGAAAGSVFSAWARSMTIAVPMACILGVCGMLAKVANDEGWNLSPDFPNATKTPLSVKHDWTLVKDLPELKTWSTDGK